MTIFSLLDQAFSEYRSRAVLKTENGQWLTYKDVDDISYKLAFYMNNKGVPAGGTVVIDMMRSPSYAVTLLSCLLQGYCIVPVNLEYPAGRKESIAKDSKADYVFTHEDFEAALELDADACKEQISAAVSEGDSAFTPRMHIPDEDDITIYVFTSGSTGRPKGVMLDQRCIAEQISRNQKVLQFCETDTYGQAASFTFIAGIDEILTPVAYGTKVIILDGDVVRNPRALADFYDEQGVTVSFIPPRVLSFFKAKSDKLRLVVAASERLTGVAPQGFRLLNEYGQSELCGSALFFDVDKAYDNTPIGRPFDGIFAYVLDEEGNEAETGELCLSGHFFSGYVDLPEQTAKVIVKNPFAQTDGNETMVRTGDIVRRDPGGDIVYINRNDWMIKLNGQRVEPGEIENVILKAHGVREAAVKDFKNESGQVYICAYFSGDTDPDTLKEEISQKLTSYMIPAFFVKLVELPKNANGKLDRLALKAPDVNEYKAEYAAPTTDEEKIVCEAFSRVLSCGEVGIDDDFFRLGGDSIKVLRLTDEIENLCGKRISSADILYAKNPKDIAALIAHIDSSEIVHSKYNIKSVALTESQKGVYLECLEEPGSTVYNMPFALRLPEKTDIDRFEKAVKKAAEQHPSLFVTISVLDGIPHMIPGDNNCVVRRTQKVSFSDAEADFVRPFDPEKGPLYRFEICSTAEGTVFLLDAHHIVSDGTSLRLLLKQIRDSYEGRGIADEKLSVFDVAEYEKNIKETKSYKDASEFFNKIFADTEFDNDLISDLGSLNPMSGQDIVITEAPAGLLPEIVEDFARKHGVTESSIFLSACAYALSKFTGNAESCFTTINNGRHEERINDTVGMFVKTLPLCIKINENAETADFIDDVQNTFYDTMRHDCISFGDLVHDFGVNSNVSFVYQSDLLSEIELEDQLLMPEELPVSDCQSKILGMMIRTRSAYEFRVHYKKKYFSRKYIESFSDTVFSVVKGLLNCECLKDIILIDEKGKEFIDQINLTDKAYDFSETVNSLLEKKIKEYPDKKMLSCNEESYTFAEFDLITRKIAGYILNKKIKAEDFVAVMAPRDASSIIASWGVIRSGAGLQTLDPGYPAERLNYMVRDSKAELVISEKKYIHLLNEYKGDVLLVEDIEALENETEELPKVKAENALALIYTSGTTGKPKGCILENRNFIALYHCYKDKMKLDENSKIASYASLGFDAGLMDLIITPILGAELCIVPDEIRIDFPRLDAFFIDNKITHGSLTTQVARMFAEHTTCKTLKTIIFGGEKLVPFNPQAGIDTYNAYGPCEATVFISSFKVKDNDSIQPVGKANYNTKLYVSDRFDRLMPVGAAGELYISGRQVGRGYLGLPEKTKEVYIKNPFSDLPGYERVYKTGDIVRFLADGNLEVIGRRDSQVKVRGFRIELTEVEEVIRRFKGIKDAAVAAFDDPAGGKYVCAYITGDSKIDINELNEFIGNEKPAYMIPAVTMQIDAIPYTQNNKVNKRALPKPIRQLNAENKLLPENETEQRIYDLAVELLGHDDFGVTTDLFSVGLTSIGTLKFNTLLSKDFDTAVKLSDIKKHNTVKKLAEFLSAAEDAGSFERMKDYPLMQNQMGIFIEAGRDDKNVEYNIPVLLKISEKVDADKLHDAVCAAINAHPYIKTTLKTDNNGNIRAVRNDEDKPSVEIKKLKELPSDRKLITAFDIIGSRLYRAAIYLTDKGRYLFFDFHHIIADGTSLAILLNDINRAYAGEKLETEAFSGYEAALEEEKMISSEKYAEAEKYYERLLDACNTNCLFGKCPERDPKESCANIKYNFEHCSQAITEYCKVNNVTENAFFNAVFSYTLSEFLHSDDVTYCTVYNGRNDSRLMNSFSMFVKTLPVRAAVDSKRSVIDFVRSMQEQLVDSMANDVLSFAGLANKYGLSADLFFNYQGDAFIFDHVAGETAKLEELKLSDAKAAFSIEVFLENGIYKAAATYMTDFYCREFVEAFLDALAAAAEGFVNNDILAAVSLYSEKEREYFAGINDTYKEFEKVPAQSLIEKIAKSDPLRTAVKTKEDSLTFEELNNKANSLAHLLINLGIKADDVVGVILERTSMVPIAELGILKSGGAFLPMLPGYPDDRLEYCMTDAECKYVLSVKDIIENKKELFTADKPYKVIDLESLDLNDGCDAPQVEFSMDQLAYLIYTSGSTGTPKGVMIEQHNLSDFVQTAGIIEAQKDGNVILCMASISFDMSITEMFFSLCQGKTIYIATEKEIHDLDLMQKAFIENKVDIMMMTPSFAWNLLSIPEFEKALSKLKCIVLGAEAFQPALFVKLKKLNPDMMILNGYGPTECTQVCSVKTITDPDSITIGRPFANVQFHVMDDNGRLLPRYAIGELIISGEAVCRGYVKLPEKNKQTFFELDGKRAYRSGDLIRINKDGEAEFGGRADNQVKLRGFRIELDEVEAVMQEYDGITQCKVIVRNNGTEDFLAAYFTADEIVDIDELSAFMKTKLTYYMVPQAMMQLDKMPVTANGKLDKKALPEIHLVKKARKKKTAKKSLEERILELFISVLNLDEAYVDDNFFEIGGTSLSASKVVMQLKSEGQKIEYQDIFDHQTAEELAEYLESLSTTAVDKKIEEDKKISSDQGDSISEVLKYNSMEYADLLERRSLGDILLTGAVGFLGVHVLKELIDIETGHICCIMRKGSFDDIITRLKTTLVYYFEDDFEEIIKERITAIEGDITDDDIVEKFKDIKFDTLINCAASVKHYANDNSIEFVNVHGVENLIELTKLKNARMIQISTTSVPGAHTDESYRRNLKMHENQLFVIDDINNQYGQSKYKAELKMIDAINSGMKGKIIRVGNLMGRHSDGEFQTNMHTNAFLNGLRGFVNIGKYPISHATDPMSFSAVDCTARAIVLLAGTNDIFTAFNAQSRSIFDEMKIFEAINRCGISVKPVSDKEYYDDFYKAMGDPEMNEKVSALLSNDRPDIHMVETDTKFTANILYRLGFSWPFIDDDYLEKVIKSLDSLDFFFSDQGKS